MMSKLSLLNIVSVISLSIASSMALAYPSVEIFATRSDVITGIQPNMKRCNIDDAVAITDTLNHMADKLVQQGKNEQEIDDALSHAFAANQQHMADAATCLSDAINVGIKKLPAVLINQNVVVYGDRDVTHAVFLALQAEQTGEAR